MPTIPTVTLNNGVEMPILERMAENLAVFDFDLTDHQVAQIAGLDTTQTDR